MVEIARAASDFYLLEEELTEEERGWRDRTRAFCETEVLPVANGYWERAEFPFELVPKLAEVGIAGGTIEGWGCPGMSVVAAGLVAKELGRADGSFGTFFGVHSGLVMTSIAQLGSEEQKERWLPRLARLDAIGAFALTEPEHGSDAVALEATARTAEDGFVLDGRKRWIGNATFADVVIVWARGDDGEVGGYLVERDTEGMRAEPIVGKASQRAVWQADVSLDGVRVDADAKLPGARSYSDVTRVLTQTRYLVAWRALGYAEAAYEHALAHVRERRQFGRALVEYQLVQDRLARMTAELTAMQLICLRLSRLVADGRVTAGMASLAKLKCAHAARWLVGEARDLLGGDGILLDRHVARLQADLEALYTFEGTDSIQALIVGRELTGVQAFSR